MCIYVIYLAVKCNILRNFTATDISELKTKAINNSAKSLFDYICQFCDLVKQLFVNLHRFLYLAGSLSG